MNGSPISDVSGGGVNSTTRVYPGDSKMGVSLRRGSCTISKYPKDHDLEVLRETEIQVEVE